MIQDILQVAFTQLMPYLAPLIVLLGGVLFADRLIFIMKDIFLQPEKNRRSY